MNQLHDQAALYVVDALTPEETYDFESHLAGCRACQEEVADMRNVTQYLATSVEADPPASLRAAVLSGIVDTAQEPAGNVVSIDSRRPSRLPYLVAAASVLLALVSGGWALQSRQDAQQAGERQAEIVQLLGAGDVRTVSGTGPRGSSATVVLSKANSQAVFVASDMPALPSGKVYELWTISGRPVPAGTFTAERGASLVALPDAALSADRIAVTVEPTGGSEHPTTAMLMALRLA